MVYGVLIVDLLVDPSNGYVLSTSAMCNVPRYVIWIFVPYFPGLRRRPATMCNKPRAAQTALALSRPPQTTTPTTAGSA
jgi:hypothetical protein